MNEMGGVVSLFFSIDNRLDLLVVLILVTVFGGGICLLGLIDTYQKRKKLGKNFIWMERENDILSILNLLLIVILWIAMFAVW